MDVAEFIPRWTESSASERANKDAFLLELCDVLGVPRPDPTTGDSAADRYVFERDAVLVAEGQKRSVGKIDLYKDGCFLLEAKQGSEKGSPKLGTAKRNTPGWNVAMRDAFGQALGYARMLERPPPFLLTCDIGYCFDLYACFDGTTDYRPFPNAQTSRIFLVDLGDYLDTLRAIFLDPGSLDPARHAARVTREVAGHLAALARELEAAGHAPESVASFLMRCLFTMFAEDVGLLPDRLFTKALEEQWIPHPEKFRVDVVNLWASMNDGGWSVAGKLLRFNGGLFARQDSLPLERRHLQLLLDAARCDWAHVEPAIFGTLLERALDPRERHALGAHYTPRAYVERLVKPTIEEPLRAEWAVVQTEARALALRGKVADAEKAVRGFHERLCHVRVLDPACGSGNFLYVTLDLFKRLESEVLAFAGELSGSVVLADMQNVSVTPAQFRGIEIKPWAREIAELVLWIGYLQWHYRTHRNVAPREPVLRDYKNIELRDAVLAYDGEEVVLDEHGKPVTRWDGHTTKKHPVTGEDVPDETSRIAVTRLVNPRKAVWPDADFIVGNPPFIGNKRMRQALGDGYVEALRATHDDVPETVDYVMYWWNHAAGLVRAGKARRFGLITTNSITQTFNRGVVQRHLEVRHPVSIAFAVADHPWVDSEDGAAVRIAMTTVCSAASLGQRIDVVKEIPAQNGEIEVVTLSRHGRVNSDLTIGSDVKGGVVPLESNRDLCLQGCKLVGAGFRIGPADRSRLLSLQPDAARFVPLYVSGSDLTKRIEHTYVIDFYGFSEEAAREAFPSGFQIVLDRVKPERDHNRREVRRRNWWLFGENAPKLRRANSTLKRFIATSEVAKYRIFVFLDLPGTVADGSLAAISLEDAFFLGVLSSRLHVAWSLASGGRMGMGNDPRYQNGPCFLPFPFPVCFDDPRSRIRDLGEQLDTHRKHQQAQHADLTITGMYNVLEKLRSGAPLTAKEKEIHEKGLVSVLKEIHDALDAAVFDAYGWPHDLTDEQILERLVALNAERAAEEKRGLVRWLRPEFQNPSGTGMETQTELAGTDTEVAPAVAAKLPKWPAKLADQISAVRNLAGTGASSWSVEEAASQFKGARRSAVAEVLDSLAALGFVVSYEADGTRRWKAPDRAAA